MKKFIFALIFCFIAFSVSAETVRFITGKPPVAGGLTCTNGSGDSAIATQNTGTLDSGVTLEQWRNQQFHFDVTTRLTKIVLVITDSNNTGSLNIAIYADSSNVPTGSAISGTTVTVEASSIEYDANGVAVDFVFSSPWEATANTLYHIVAYGTGTDPLFYWKYVDTGNPYADGLSGYSSDSGANWTANDSAIDRRFIIYGCQ